MPIARVGGKLIYYAHVPKCAGSSVEDYLAARFGPLAFLDRRHFTRPARGRWSQTSPQHIDTASLDILFPPDFFDAAFGVVRHPAGRLVSAFRYQKARRRLGMRASLDDWLTLHSRKSAHHPFLFDSHFRPMVDFVPETARVFKLEEGTAAIVQWLDQVAGDTEGPRDLPKANKAQDVVWRPKAPWKKLVKRVFERPVPDLTEGYCRRIHELYRADYERFDYGVFDPLETPRPRTPEPLVAAGR